MLVPVSNGAVVMYWWAITWEASLMMIAASVDSQCELGEMKIKYLSKRFSKFSSSGPSCTGSVLCGCHVSSQ